MMKLFFVFACLLAVEFAGAQRVELTGPAGSAGFGSQVLVLENGNYVVTDPFYNEGAAYGAGAVYVYNGSNNSLISTLKGSNANDQVGKAVQKLGNSFFAVISNNWNGARGAVTVINGTTGMNGVVSSSNSLVGSNPNDLVGGNNGIIRLANGNCVIASPYWNGAAGAVTWCNPAAGISGVVSSANSLTGSSANDYAGGYIEALDNGNYIAITVNWANGGAANAGAITWCNGLTGTTGAISSANSFVGTAANDRIGNAFQKLANGNYVFSSQQWNNGGANDAGAVTFVSKTGPTSGPVSSANSVIGTQVNERAGSGGIALLTNGNYVIGSPNYAGGSGAATWCSGVSGGTGTISTANSLTGNYGNDNVGYAVYALANGHYMVVSPFADMIVGAAYTTDAGAITWGNGITGTTGNISTANSITGASNGDRIGLYNVTGGTLSLPNGNFIAMSPNWDYGSITDAGAVTLINGAAASTGTVGISNSLVGNYINQQLGSGNFTRLVFLPNGNFVIGNPFWDNGAATDAGAVTFSNGVTGVTGIISAANSLTGSNANDLVGMIVQPLRNSNYVIGSRLWDNGSVQNAGAVTFASGVTGISGTISAANSIIGSKAGDQVGFSIDTLINNDNFVVTSPFWDNGPVTDAGAVTLVNGGTGITGTISAANSLTGSTASDMVGYDYYSTGNPNDALTKLPNGNYVICSPNWDNGAAANAGAVTLCNGTTPTTGAVSLTNSLAGKTAEDKIGYCAVPGTGFFSGITVLANGNYVVGSRSYDNGSSLNAGAITWCSGTTPTTGVVNVTNSLLGSSTGDQLGITSGFYDADVKAIDANKYLVNSRRWQNGPAAKKSLTYSNFGNAGITGIINGCNSVLGNTPYGDYLPEYNPVYDNIIAGSNAENKVTVIYGSLNTLLAQDKDSVYSNIFDNTELLIHNNQCRLIAAIKPAGADPVNGWIKAKAWVETSMPTVAGQPFVARHFEITPSSNAGTATGRVTLYFTQQEFDDFNNHPNSILNLPAGPADAAGKLNLRVGKYSGTSADGTGLPGTYPGAATVIDPDDADIVWNGSENRWQVSFDISGFSGFVIQTEVSVLPLQLLSFTAQPCNHNDACLNWKTAHEQQVRHFEVERSFNGSSFTKIGAVQAGANNYSFTDARVFNTNAAAYYRIRQVDDNGAFTYSPIILVKHKSEYARVYPTIAKGTVHVQLTGMPIAVFELFDGTGKRCLVEKLLQANNTINISRLGQGMYHYRVQLNNTATVTGTILVN